MKITKLEGHSKDYIGISIAVTLIALAIVGRVMPHPANFTPVAAVAIFGGAILPRRWALSLPLLAMIVSDLIIGLHPLIMFTWGSFAVIAFLSSYKLKSISFSNVALSSLGASILFFVVSNFGVWIEGRLYARTLSGLAECYINAVPFFRNTLLGDVIFSAILFGTYVFAYKILRPSRVVINS